MNITHFFTYIQILHGDEPVSIQISSTLVQIDNWNFLIDTGFVDQSDVVYVLNKLGVSAHDIHYILNTHIHPDHVGGNQHFPQAEIYLSEKDYVFQRDFINAIAEAEDAPLSNVVKIFYPQFNENQLELYARLSTQMAAHWKDDLVGNLEQIHYIEEDWPFDFIEVVETPGHSIQHYSFRVDTPGKPFLVTGDALPTKTSFRQNKLDFPYCHDAGLYLESQKKIGEFQGIIVPGHDKPFDTETGEYLEEYDAGGVEDGNGHHEDLI
jgi:glyoxylase-like metal-dependent hydrolase (beta-lactamase superfamily II)